FFQAEDGIRDFHVTGVQTCALPISHTDTQACSPSPPADTVMVHPSPAWLIALWTRLAIDSCNSASLPSTHMEWPPPLPSPLLPCIQPRSCCFSLANGRYKSTTSRASALRSTGI